MIKNPAQARHYAKHRDRRCSEMRESAKKNRPQRNAYLRGWRKREPELEYLRKARYRLKRYGLTAEQYYAMFDKQKGLCLICEIKLNAAQAHCGDSAVIDHKGETVRGILCNRCNQAIGLLKDSINSLTNAILYLERF